MPPTYQRTTVTPMLTSRTPHYLSVEERRARASAPAIAHPARASAVGSVARCPDPVSTLTAQNETPRTRPRPHPARPDDGLALHLLPRGRQHHGVGPRDRAHAGLKVQLCGDAHLSNFGVFASPERQLLFDINDFDETLPGPFEWDVARLAASFVIASRNNGFTEEEARASAVDRGHGLPGGDGRLRADAHAGDLVRAHAGRGDPRFGAHAEIAAVHPTRIGPLADAATASRRYEAGRDGRRALPDRVAAPGGHADP